MIIKIVLVITALAGLALLRSEWEKRHPAADFYSFGKGQNTFRIAYIADCHGNFINGKVIDIIKKQKPDAVIVGGDIITCWKYRDLKTGIDEALEFSRELCTITPVIFSEGNHESRFERRFPDDYAKFVENLKRMGVIYLKNEKTVLEIPGFKTTEASCADLKEKGEKESGKKITIYGLSMDKLYFDHNKPQLFAKHEKMDDDYIETKVGKCGSNSYNILLMHTPLYAVKAAKWGADLVISAHFHGGTIWLGKYLGGLMTPQYGFFVRECQGVFRTDRSNLESTENKNNRKSEDSKVKPESEDGKVKPKCAESKAKLIFADKKGNKLLNNDDGETYLLVNRGIGTHSIKIRFMDRPEVSVIDINI